MRVVLENMRGLSAKCREMRFSRNYFVEEKPVDQVHGSMDHPWLSPPWTICGQAARARRSLASGRSGAQGRQPRGGGWGYGVVEPVKGLTGGRATTRWPVDGGEWAAVVDVPVRGEGGSEEGWCCPGCSRWLL
jgi:hypothetical protein